MFNSVLSSVGALGSTGGSLPGQANTALGAVIAGNSVIRVQTGTPQSLQRFNLSTLQQDMQVNLAEAVMDITPATVGTTNGMRPMRRRCYRSCRC